MEKLTFTGWFDVNLAFGSRDKAFLFSFGQLAPAVWGLKGEYISFVWYVQKKSFEHFYKDYFYS